MPDSYSHTLRNEIAALEDYMHSHILGQQKLVSRMLVSLLADGHLLVEGAPGLAKTRAVKMLANGIEGDFQRIQFTPDLLPSDLTGTDIYRPQDASFKFQAGPLFNDIIVADEINRAPAKVQAALLEAMEERQITVGNQTYPLSHLFFVMATQNPIEQEGTYPLPEAQLDRFLLKVTIEYPKVDAEIEIMRQVRQEASNKNPEDRETNNLKHPLPISQNTLYAVRKEILNCHMAPPVEEYIAQLVLATRSPQHYSTQLSEWIEWGASPRASIAFDRCSRALAWLDNRDFVTPEDVQQLAHEVLRHRILLNYNAEMDGIDVDHVISTLLEHVPVA